ncbi:MAG: flagellar hook-basal body complex protein FliE [Phycisphaerales bacterium]|nr:flagellar hook-basal body complex protein FliE [Phycisphaerales bacterium]TVS01891.1 MAG: flagellar hook-basal body complex protein FliE [Phycisphaerales bacterium]
MTDPLGLIGGAGGAGRMNPGQTAAGGVRPDPNAPSFKDVLLQNINEANKLQQDATHAIEDLAAGRRNDIEGVVLAAQKADTAFRMLQAVRNKMVQAYDEIKQMRV